MVTKQIKINGLNLNFDKIRKYLDTYMIWHKKEIIATIEDTDIKRLKHIKTCRSDYDKLVIFTME